MQLPRNSREQIILELKQAGSMTAKELATSLGISATAVRQLLYALQADDLVTSTPVKQAQGRPYYAYSLTTRGHDQFPCAYDTLVVDLLESVKQIGGDEMVANVMKVQLSKKEERYREAIQEADLVDVAERLRKLSSLRKEDGYMSEVVEDGKVLKEHNCPVFRVAQAHPEMCMYEQEIMERVLGISLERTAHMVDGEHVCSFRVCSRNLHKIVMPGKTDEDEDSE